jgi:hypothetical protein
MENQAILQMMKSMLPTTLPTKELSSFEYGVLAGQQLMYDIVHSRLKAQEPHNNTKDK